MTTIKHATVPTPEDTPRWRRTNIIIDMAIGSGLALLLTTMITVAIAAQHRY
jgi:hypothetical protein